MAIISLLTDFGLQDNFVGVLKAVILKINPQVTLVDISHEIKAQDTPGAAFLLKSAFKYFPSQTVHLVVVDPGVGSTRKKLLVETKNYFFIAADNGVLSLALKEERPLKIIEITNDKYFLKPVSDTFHGRDIFAPVAAYVSRGMDVPKFGRLIKSYKSLDLPAIQRNSRQLSGEVIHIDRFGNLISNIDKDTFKKFIRNKKYQVRIKNKIIPKLSRSYSEGEPLKPLALMDSFNFLEVAINSGSCRDYLGADIGTKIKAIRNR